MKTFIIGIAGGSGSGKTTFTKKLIEVFKSNSVSVVQHDSYYRDISSYKNPDPSLINFDHPSSLETSLLIKHLAKLKKSKSVNIPIYDYSTHSRKKETRKIIPTKLIIIEGILIFADEDLRKMFDLKIFVDTDADERIMRRIIRDTFERGRSVDSVIHQYRNTVKPMHLQFVDPSKNWADIIIPHGGENIVAVDLVARSIKSFIKNKN